MNKIGKNLRGQFRFGTKAETLERLKPLVETAKIPTLFYFNVGQWEVDPAYILSEVQSIFGITNSLIFRSSTKNEDSKQQSYAGAYNSHLNVPPDNNSIKNAIQTLVSSFDGLKENQILVMPMLTGIIRSGVVTTHEIESGAPYYVLNYDDESGKSDTVTGGIGVNKTVLVHRDFSLSDLDSPKILEILSMVQEIEYLCKRGTALDIEFATTSKEGLFLLQARRIVVKDKWNRHGSRHVGNSLFHAEQFVNYHTSPKKQLLGQSSILGQMPDWNPAEIIGIRPKPLAISLYRYLITDSVWQEARASMGYKSVRGVPLMLIFGGCPYIDVRASFNSFLPAYLPPRLGQKLVDSWINRLECYPEYHDKVEFNVAQTTIDFTFQVNHHSWYPNILDNQEYNQYRDLLVDLTISNLSLKSSASLGLALRKINELKKLQRIRNQELYFRDKHRSLSEALILLEECRDYGTRPFAVIARHAFIAESIIRSAVSCGILSKNRFNDFKSSIHTVTSEFTDDFVVAYYEESKRAKFLAKYGHLRPGTYEITSSRYDQRSDIFAMKNLTSKQKKQISFELRASEYSAFRKQFLASGLSQIDPNHFIEYAEKAITYREKAKFIFTRHLSNALELITDWGASVDLGRDELSYLTISDLIENRVSPVLNDPEYYYKDIIRYRSRENKNVSAIRLGYLIRSSRDLYVVPIDRSAPNFVTNKHVQGIPYMLNFETSATEALNDRLICIENADPGFDWIFTYKILGLVSKYGGANSHMTIRCAELGLPAAIGVGEQLFEAITKAKQVELNGETKILRPVYQS